MKKNENNKTPSEIVLHHFDVHCTETSVLSIAAAYILQLEYFTNHWGHPFLILKLIESDILINKVNFF